MNTNRNYKFNPAPGWPIPPKGWVPPEGWRPEPTWPAAPQGWDFWIPVADTGNDKADSAPFEAPSQEAKDVTQTSVETAVRPKIGFFNGKRLATQLSDENDRLRQLIEQYGLQDIEARTRALMAISEQLRSEELQLKKLGEEIAASEAKLTSLQQSIVSAEDAIELQEVGHYTYLHPAEHSTDLATDLADVRSRIKELQRSKEATQATSNFTFNNSEAKGRKFVNDLSKLMLRAYNAEAENCVKSVRAGNLASAQKRLSGVVDSVARQGTMIDLRINAEYHRLRLQELKLAARHLDAVKAEKEAERAHREELREQRKAEAELTAARDKLSKEKAHYERAIEALISRGDSSGADELRDLLAAVDEKLTDVELRAANIRAGHVYVISNRGTFGEQIIKIGMTRRLEPMDRVRELGDASVPFRFDIHALFFAEDAVGVESMLHKAFEDRRVNKVNLRREFFYATPAEVLSVLEQHNVHLVEFTETPESEEYTLSMQTKALSPTY